jgi:choline dehydrogenase-like flavoprotein
MDRDPHLGVVDENCRLHGCGNFYIGGSSVFPNYSFDAPTMTVVALALRLSDHLMAGLAAPPRLSSSSAPLSPTPTPVSMGVER